MPWFKAHGNKKDQAEVIGEYGRDPSSSPTSPNRKAGRMGGKPDLKHLGVKHEPEEITFKELAVGMLFCAGCIAVAMAAFWVKGVYF